MTTSLPKLRPFVCGALAGAVLTTSLLSTRPAHAEPVSPTAKGIVGGAFLGGEIVCFAEALFGVRSTAAYLIGAGLGAAGGGVAGYAIESSVDDGRIPAYMLAGGLALLIPAIVVTLDATRYLPTEGAREDKPVNTQSPSDPGQPGGSSVVGAEPNKGAAPPATTPEGTTPPSSTPPSTTPTTPPAGGGGGTQAPRAPQSPQSGLFNVREGNFAMGIPVPEVRPVLGTAERARMGVDNRGSELRFPVVRVTF